MHKYNTRVSILTYCIVMLDFSSLLAQMKYYCRAITLYVSSYLLNVHALDVRAGNNVKNTIFKTDKFGRISLPFLQVQKKREFGGREHVTTASVHSIELYVNWNDKSRGKLKPL